MYMKKKLSAIVRQLVKVVRNTYSVLQMKTGVELIDS